MTTSTLSDDVRSALARRKYSPRTAEAYVHWTREFVRFHGDRPPREMAAPEVAAFLNDLTTGRRAAASTHNQALCALVFLYRHVLERPLGPIAELTAPTQTADGAAVLSRTEVRAVLDALESPFRLIAELLYGSGLRLVECLALRVRDVDIERRRITVRGPHGDDDRAALLPVAAGDALRTQLAHVERRHRKELAGGRGAVDVPEQRSVGMRDTAPSLAWRHLFPSSRSCTDPATGEPILQHVHERAVQNAVLEAARTAGIGNRVTPSALRHSFAAHLFEAGTDICLIQALLGHKDIRRTMLLTRIVDRSPLGVVSPLDR